jgi:hypothetical protein
MLKATFATWVASKTHTAISIRRLTWLIFARTATNRVLLRAFRHLAAAVFGSGMLLARALTPPSAMSSVVAKSRLASRVAARATVALGLFRLGAIA